LQLIELLGDLGLRFLQLLRRLVGLLGTRFGVVLGQVLPGLVHVLGAVVDLVGRLGRGLFEILGQVLGLRRQLALLLGQVLGVRRLGRLGRILGLVGDVALFLGQAVEFLGGVLQLGYVFATFLGLRDLLLQLVLGLLQGLDRVILLVDRFVR